ncbi:hypothetical protein EJ03DRAFT_329669 [Teratosphaeria nubilosa]|uniref:DNA mismatch repair protein S5 domain-containing protein n=1 Tax=Teratosphaeria nubilosa TaxID=161662 RepID=A0A6G1L1V2_9PEZI|nr:hypothetical protein EJ03DRAFT_329669 [Teratosphaeria nubilosa]
MAIGKLDHAAVRVIGASQVLTDSATVVKELIDNALDAHATSVAIEIHHNTLDVIQVRDNGHGIAPEDRAMVATPNCTSKLVNIDDLKAVAGVSLGFRGQALAAAAELSGSMSVSTRIEGEAVATALKINQRGEVVGQDRVSLPVGTTVRMADFIKANPVRRQVALKNTEKCLKKIKQTLQAYAFARPQVRFSLKVLLAKDQKLNWMYPPKPDGSVEEAAIKIVGSACVSQCIVSVVEESGFTLHAFVPRPDAEVVKVSGLGSFISIDARPVSASRGTLKQVVKIFRDSLKAANRAFDGVKEPFIYLRIDCPAASYDPNVEPAKDDVFFEHPDLILDASRKLFGAVYAPEPTTSAQVPQQLQTLGATPLPPDRHDEDNSFAPVGQRHSPLMNGRPRVDLDEVPRLQPLPASADDGGDVGEGFMPQQAFRSNMYGCDEEEDVDILHAQSSIRRTERDLAELREASADVTTSNPWVMAKLNTSVRRPALDASPLRTCSPDRQAGCTAIPPSQPGLPTPRPSSPSPPVDGLHPTEHGPIMRIRAGGGLMDAPDGFSPRTEMPPPSSPSRGYRNDAAPDLNHPHHHPAYNYSLASDTTEASTGTPLHAIPDAVQRPRKSAQKRAQGRINKPFISPMIDQPQVEKVYFDHLENTDRSRTKARRPYQNHTSDGLVRQGELGDLMDEPRALTPPRRNRDIRDFVDSVALTGGESASSMVERRMYGRQAGRRSRSASVDRRRPSIPGDENASPVKNLLSARGFMPASELAAIEERFGPLEKQPARPAKRRKTGEGVLRQVSGNVRSPAHLTAEEDDTDEQSPAQKPARRVDEDEDFDISDRRTATRRRRTTGDGTSRKVTRTKSSRLPLERIPKGAGMHNIEFKLSTSLHAVSSWAGKIGEGSSLLGWNEPAIDAYDTFGDAPDHQEIMRIGEKVKRLLTSKVSDGEMVQDVTSLMREAFAARARGDVEADMYADVVPEDVE